MKLSDILKRLSPDFLCGMNLSESASQTEISNIVSDSRKVTEGSLFVCIEGTHSDGHDFIKDAVKNGAVVIVANRGRLPHNMGILKKEDIYSSSDVPLSEKENNALNRDIPLIEVDNTRRALAFLWSAWYNKPDEYMKIVAVTGTNGKTSTAYILRAILRSAGYKTGIIGTVRTLIDDTEIDTCGGSDMKGIPSAMTTPDPEILYQILDKMRDSGVEYVIMEASSHALELHKLDALKIDTAIFTNLTPEHLDFHGTMQNYLAAKTKLFKIAPVGIINADDKYSDELMAGAPLCRYITCSVNVDRALKINSDTLAADIRLLGIDGVEYLFNSASAVFRVRSLIPGYFTVCNTMLAVRCAMFLGIDIITIQDSVRCMGGVDGRLERIRLDETKADFAVFVDYAHTPAALESVLYAVRDFRSQNQKIILLFGCGGDRDRSKRKTMGAIASKLADFSIITSDNSRTENKTEIISEIMRGFDKEKPYIVIEDRREAIKYAVENAKNGDILLLVGKGHEKYEIDENGKHPFDEAQIVRDALENKYKNEKSDL